MNGFTPPTEGINATACVVQPSQCTAWQVHELSQLQAGRMLVACYQHELPECTQLMAAPAGLQQ